MGKTEIPYANKGWNPVVGCPLPLCSDGCSQCWAGKLHNLRHRAYLAGRKLPEMYAKPYEEIQFFPERIEQPLHWKKPQTIFVGSQTDLFHKDIKDEWIDSIVGQCDGAGVKVFVKQVHLPKCHLDAYPRTIAGMDRLSEKHGFRVSIDPAEWPEKLQRRELI